MEVRSPAVAGAFYPFSKETVLRQLKDLFAYWKIDVDTVKKRKRVACFGVVAPHAGYEYSGYVAARVFADIPKADTVILLGPNHYGLGPDISVSLAGAWETPLGKVKVDERMAAELTTEFPVAKMDEMAHLREHSIEVQLPFLQTVLDEFEIVPISIKHYAPDKRFLEVCEGLGKAIASVVNGKGKTLVVSSTDFTHYEPQVVAKKKDDMAMKAIEKLDGAGLFKVISDNDISMCGYAGVAANIAACKELGAKKAERVAYMTSGDTTGDTSAVVGYGGLRIV